jgi:DNA repair exonuclease SbcCD ATPase subunit
MAVPVPEGNDAKPESQKRRNWWIWISAALGIAAVGVLIWALGMKSENDNANDQLVTTQRELVATQEELERAQQEPARASTPEPEDDSRDGRPVLTAGAVAAITALINDLQEELGATEQDLEAAEQDLEEATKQAEEADQKAAKAKKQAEQAGDATDKAEAEADQAEAEVEAAESRAAIARECARAYVTAIGQLFEGENPEDQATEVRDQLQDVTAHCKSAFADA